MLEAFHACLLEEGLYFSEIFVSPVARQTWRAAESHAAAFARGGVYHVHIIAYPAACQQRVASHVYAFAAGIVHEGFEAGYVFIRNVLGVESGTEAEDYHLIAGVGTLVHGRLHHFGIS